MEYFTDYSNSFYSPQIQWELPHTASLQYGKQLAVYTQIPLQCSMLSTSDSQQMYQVQSVQQVYAIQSVPTVISVTSNETISVVPQDQQDQLKEQEEEGDKEPEVDYNSFQSIKQFEDWSKSVSLSPERRKSVREDIRKSRQKLTRTFKASFLCKLLALFGFTPVYQRPRKDSLKTFCLVIESIIDSTGKTVWTYQDSLDVIAEYYKSKGKGRNDVRECVMVIQMNIMLFLLEEEGVEIHFGPLKKMGFHLLLTTENVLALTYKKTTYSPDDMLILGEEYFSSEIKPTIDQFY